MLWLYLALIAYFINAVAFIIDKHLLASHIPKPFAYAFGVSVLSVLSLLLIPFGVSWFGLGYFLVASMSGAIFFIALFFLYKSIRSSEVSVASTITATMTAIFTYLFSVLILKDKLGLNNEFAFILLVLGIFSLGMVKKEKEVIGYSILSGLLLGLSMVLLKWTFNASDFVNGVFWTRVGFVGSSFFTLIFPYARKEVYSSYKNAPRLSMFIFILNKIIAGTGFIIYYYAIRLGSVSLVNALLGTQFVFILVLALIFKNRVMSVSENLRGRVLFKKLIGIALIAGGFLMLFRW